MLNHVRFQNASKVFLQLLRPHPLWHRKEGILSKSEVLWLTAVDKKKSIFLKGIAVSKGLAGQECHINLLHEKLSAWNWRGRGTGEGERNTISHSSQNRKRSILRTLSPWISSLKITFPPLKIDLSLIAILSIFIFVINIYFIWQKDAYKSEVYIFLKTSWSSKWVHNKRGVILLTQSRSFTPEHTHQHMHEKMMWVCLGWTLSVQSVSICSISLSVQLLLSALPS